MNDLREHPNWSPTRKYWRAGSWDVRLWAEPSMPGELSFDDLVMVSDSETVRLAALDGVLNVAAPDPVGLVRRGLVASSSIITRMDLDAPSALRLASEVLCDPQLRPRHRNPLATASVADLDKFDQRVRIAVCADAEVWVRASDEAWKAVLGDDMLTPEARAAWQDGPAQTPDPIERMMKQEALLDDPSCWTSPALGLVPDVPVRTTTLDKVHEIIVATDGARLTPARCLELDDWLNRGLQLRPTGSTYPSPHGDVVLLHAVFRP